MLAMVLLFVPLLLFAIWNVKTGTASVEQWLPQDEPERKKYDQFVRLFGSDHFLLVSWPGCGPEDPRLTDFSKELVAISDVADSPLIESVVSTASILDELTKGPLGLSDRVAMKRIQGVFLGRNGVGAALVQLTPEGNRRQRDSIELVMKVGDQISGLGQDQIRIGGTIYEAAEIDFASERSLRRFIIPSSLGALVVAFLCLRNVWHAIGVFLLSAIAQAASVALVYFTGTELSAVLIVLPTLVFMLTLSGAIHLVNYYRDETGDHRSVKAVRVGIRPCLLATITTAFGLASLGISELEPVREFGIYSAVSLMIGVIILLATFSGLFSLRSSPSSSGASPAMEASLPRMVNRFPNVISIIGLMLLTFGGIGLTRLESSSLIDTMFHEQSRPIQNVKWLEENVGPLMSVEILVRFDQESGADLLQRAQLVSDIHKSLVRVPGVGGVISATSFIPHLGSNKGLRNVVRRSFIRVFLKNNKTDLIESGVVQEDGNSEYWRITVKTPIFSSQEENAELTQRMKQAADPIVAELVDAGAGSIIYTGLSPVIRESQKLMLSDLAYSFSLAFVLISPVMIVLVRGVLAGLVVMIPNVVPVVLVFGCFGWLGYTIDIASVLTASVALGIAVDDTLHFVNWFSFSLTENGRTEAVRIAFRRCARAMLHTTMICSAAMFPFLFSDFLPTRRFSILMILMLNVAILGDLILLPALLLSRLGTLSFPLRPDANGR